jgi:hypothetical protein
MKPCADRQRWLSTLRWQVEGLHRTSGSNGPPDFIDRLSPLYASWGARVAQRMTVIGENREGEA